MESGNRQKRNCISKQIANPFTNTNEGDGEWMKTKKKLHFQTNNEPFSFIAKEGNNNKMVRLEIPLLYERET